MRWIIWFLGDAIQLLITWFKRKKRQREEEDRIPETLTDIERKQ